MVRYTATTSIPNRPDGKSLGLVAPDFKIRDPGWCRALGSESSAGPEWNSGVFCMAHSMAPCDGR